MKQLPFGLPHEYTIDVTTVRNLVSERNRLAEALRTVRKDTEALLLGDCDPSDENFAATLETIDKALGTDAINPNPLIELAESLAAGNYDDSEVQDMARRALVEARRFEE